MEISISCDIILPERMLKMEKLVIQDKVHKQIILEGPYIKLIQTPEFQRLKDITQTANAYLEYPNLKNTTRYEHSMGTYHVLNNIIEQLARKLEKQNIKINEEEKEVAKVAMLLHDIGHMAYSHTAEKITKYSHEKRSIDIIADEKTKIHRIIKEEWGEEFLQKVINFLQDIYLKETIPETIEIHKNRVSLANVLKSLISNNIDADRLDYQIRDSQDVGFQVLTDLDKIIQSFEVVVANDNVTIAIPEEKMYLIETMLFERARNYAKIYYGSKSVISDVVFQKLLETLKEKPEEIDFLPKDSIRDFMSLNEKEYTIQECLQITQTPIREFLEKLKEHTNDESILYLLNLEQATNGYTRITTDASKEYIQDLLQKAIPQWDAKKSSALVDETRTIKVYKSNKKNKTNIITQNGIEDFKDLEHFIDIRDKKIRTVAINAEMIRLELGISKEEFEETIQPKINSVIRSLTRSKEEFEIKYLVNQPIMDYLDFKDLLTKQFPIIQECVYHNHDNYYDDQELNFLKNGKTLRIRQGMQADGTNPVEQEIENTIKRIRIHYKTKKSSNQIFNTSKKEEEFGKSSQIQDYESFLKKQHIDGNSLEETLSVDSLRRLFTINVGGIPVDVCFNASVYQNHLYDELPGESQTIEIQTVSKNPSDRLALLKVHEYIQEKVPQLEGKIINLNMYEIGLTDTYQKYRKGMLHNEDAKKWEQENPEKVKILADTLQKVNSTASKKEEER